MSWIGIRADEARRAHKIGLDRVPLFAAGVKLSDVDIFWATQQFKLELPTPNGKTLAGNCDLCFLKGANQVYTLIHEKPARAVWWARMEATTGASKPDGARFRTDRPGYAAMAQYALDQRDMFDDEPSIECFCGD